MSRRKKYVGRPLGDEELRKRFFETLQNIRDISSTYDKGSYGLYSTLATEVQKLFIEGQGKLIRNEFFYSSPVFSISKTTMLAQMPLVIQRTETTKNGEGKIMFEPNFVAPRDKYNEIKFKEWWEDSIIYVAGNTPDGSPLGVIALGKDAVHFSKREKLTRIELIKLVRNKIGAHTDKHIPKNIDDLFNRESWGGMVVASPIIGGDIDAAAARDNVINLPIQAMVRQIAEEVCLSIPQE